LKGYGGMGGKAVEDRESTLNMWDICCQATNSDGFYGLISHYDV
jgi:hypothetical protein